MASVIERFEKKFQPIPFSGCWIWTGSIHPWGYGRFCVDGKTAKAHRVSYKLYKGDIPKGLLVCHTCDNPDCVNPNHLFTGTVAENNIDKTKKGRASKKLNANKVTEIRGLLNAGSSLNELARKFNVTRSMIVQIKYKRNWKEI